MFEVQYEDQKGEKKDVWQTSWGQPEVLEQ